MRDPIADLKHELLAAAERQQQQHAAAGAGRRRLHVSLTRNRLAPHDGDGGSRRCRGARLHSPWRQRRPGFLERSAGGGHATRGDDPAHEVGADDDFERPRVHGHTRSERDLDRSDAAAQVARPVQRPPTGCARCASSSAPRNALRGGRLGQSALRPRQAKRHTGNGQVRAAEHAGSTPRVHSLLK